VLETAVIWPSPAWDRVTYWALDLETGGLDARSDPVLAVGMVPIRAGAIRLGEAYASLVRPADTAAIDPASIPAHHLVPGDVRAAPPLEDVLFEVDRRLRDGVLLVHQAAIDVRFLKVAYKRARLRYPDPKVVDTVVLLFKAAKRARFVNPDAPAIEPDLNLGNARKANGLPVYAQHDAVTDAIAAAELFLVLRRRLGARTLRDLR
jgi:DNA polymerase-3 subunit epsilon